MLCYYKASPRAGDLTRGTIEAAGLDLKSAESCVVPARESRSVTTDLILKLPLNTYGRICSRSGLAFKHGIEVGAGVIDSDYRGIVHILIHNYSNTDYVVQCGDRIAQIVIQPYVMCDVVEVESVDELQATERGVKGFGSTGK